MSEAPKPPATAEVILQAVIEAAALCGPFDPLQLLPSDLAPDLRSEILRRLGRFVDETLSDGLPRWVLKADERRRVLSGLANAKAVNKILARTAPPDNDPFAKALKSALTGHDSKALPGENHDAAYAARNFAMAAPYAATRKSADPLALRHQIAAEQAEARQRVVLPHRLYGRDDVRASIGEFLANAAATPQGVLLVTRTSRRMGNGRGTARSCSERWR